MTTTINPVSISQPQQTKNTNVNRFSPVEVATDVRKGLNDVGEVTKGATVGIVQGIFAGTASFLTLWAVDVLKNLKNPEAQTSMIKDFAKPIAESVGKAITSIPKAAKALFTQSFGKTLKNVLVDAPVKMVKAFKNTNRISTPAKAVVGLITAAVVVGNIVKAKLSANEKNAAIDHRWQVGHDKV